MTTISPFHLSRSSGVHLATPPRKKVATENLSKVLGKNRPQQFLESDEKSASNTFSRINYKFGLRKSNNKKVVSTPLKKYSSSRKNNQLCIKLVKTDQRQGHSPDCERSENTISRKAKPKATSDRNKNVSGGEQISGHRSSGIVEEGEHLLEDQRINLSATFFLTPKKYGRFRPIINLKKLNQFIPYSHFKMESLKQLKDLLRQNDLMVKIDLKDAYFSIPLHPETQKHVRFPGKGNLYQFLCLF